MTAAAVDSHIPPIFSSRALRAAEAVDSPAPAVDSASCPPTPPYLSTHPNEHLDTCSAGRAGGCDVGCVRGEPREGEWAADEGSREAPDVVGHVEAAQEGLSLIHI